MSLGKSLSVNSIKQSSFQSSQAVRVRRNRQMKTKLIWGGAVLTILMVFGISLFRQIKKAFGTITFALSKTSIEAYMT